MIGEEIYPISQDAGDVYNELTVIERSDLAVASTYRIADLNRNKRNNHSVWTVREIGKNAADEVVYVKIIYNAEQKPSWVPDAVWPDQINRN